MTLQSQTLFRMMTDRLGYVSERQKVLAQNVANADTPGFKAKDLKPVDFFDEVRKSSRRLQMASTSGAHLGGSAPTSAYRADATRSYETKPDKNSVVMEEQMFKINDNQGAYQLTTTLYKKYVDMMKTTLSRG